MKKQLCVCIYSAVKAQKVKGMPENDFMVVVKSLKLWKMA